MGFKSGKAWNGNKFGAPKKQFRRDDFTEELFNESKDDVRSVKNRLIMHALNDKPWAIKLVCEYALTKPKSRDEGAEEVNQMIQEEMLHVSKDVLETMRRDFVGMLSKCNESERE